MSCHVLSFSEVDGFFQKLGSLEVKECGPYASVAKGKPEWCPFSIKEGIFFTICGCCLVLFSDSTG